MTRKKDPESCPIDDLFQSMDLGAPTSEPIRTSDLQRVRANSGIMNPLGIQRAAARPAVKWRPPEHATPLPNEFGFASAFADVIDKKRTGKVLIHGSDASTTMHVADGSPFLVEGETLGESLGRTLLTRGTISKKQLAEAMDRSTELPFQYEEIRLGEVLIELGHAAPEIVSGALAEQVRSKVIKCFSHNPVLALIEELDDATDDIVRFPVFGPALLLEGIRAAYDLERLKPILERRMNDLPALAESAAEVIDRLGVRPPERRWLRQIDGKQTTQELIDRATIDRVVATQLIATLFLSNLLVMTRSVAAPVKGPAVAMSRLDKKDDAATKFAAQGRSLLLQGSPTLALMSFQRALASKPDHTECLMFAAHCEYLVTKDGAERERLAELASEHATKVLALQWTHARAHYIVGTSLLDKKYNDKARKHFQLAAEHDPRDPDAAKMVKLLGRQPMPKR